MQSDDAGSEDGGRGSTGRCPPACADATIPAGPTTGGLILTGEGRVGFELARRGRGRTTRLRVDFRGVAQPHRPVLSQSHRVEPV